MNLSALLNREPPVPWCEGSKLPWSDPEFSSRMLQEHLSLEHGRASRQLDRIERHVQWIDDTVLGGQPGRVLDLGCGPGLYTLRLATLGHRCVGIDFGPASIEYARADAERQGLPCEYRLQDLRDGDFGDGFGAVLLVFGELNTFTPAETGRLLEAARQSLVPSGALILEVHTEACVREIGEEGPTWFVDDRGLFSQRPHLCLRECTWHEAARAAVERYDVIDLETADVETYLSTTQAWSEDEYAALLRGSGFDRWERHASLTGDDGTPEAGLFVIVARKP